MNKFLHFHLHFHEFSMGFPKTKKFIVFTILGGEWFRISKEILARVLLSRIQQMRVLCQ